MVDDDSAPALARRLSLLAPAVSVWRSDDSGLTPVAPEPFDDPPTSPEVHPPTLAGVELVVEAGIPRLEVLGLEIGRYVPEPGSGHPRLSVGIGRFDREAGELLNAGRAPEATLASVVDQVTAVRHPGAAPHAINRLARDRWLRSVLVDDPGMVGCRRLAPVEPARARSNLRDPSTAPAVGDSMSGESVLVVCAVGMDLEAVPDAADLATRHHPARIVIAVPERDVGPALISLAGLLDRPADVIGLATPWLP